MRKFKMRCFITACAAAVLGTVVSQSQAVVISPTLLSSANTNALSDPINLTNNSGLSIPVNTGASLATALSSVHVFDGGFAQSWVTNAAAPDYFATQPAPTFVYDLGRELPVTDLLLWQYQNTGGGTTSAGNAARSFEVRFASAASGPVFGGVADFTSNAQTVAQIGGINSAQRFDLTGVGEEATARYVQVTITDNQRGVGVVTAGGDRVGLGELRFNVDTTNGIVASFDLGGGELYTGAGPADPNSPTTWTAVTGSTTDPFSGINLNVFDGSGFINSNPAGSNVFDLLNDFVFDGTGDAPGIQTAQWTLTGLNDSIFYDLYFIAPNGQQFASTNVYGGSYEALGQAALASGSTNSFTTWVEGVQYAVLRGLRSTGGVISGFYNENPNDLSSGNFGIAGLQVVAYTIPEPASIGLLALAGLSLARRRSRPC